MKQIAWLLPVVLVVACLCAADVFADTTTVVYRPESYELVVHAGDYDRVNTPVTVTIAVPKEWADVELSLTAQGSTIPAPPFSAFGGVQMTPPSLLNDAMPLQEVSGKVLREFHFVLDELKKGETKKYSLCAYDRTHNPFTEDLDSPFSKTPGFSWTDEEGLYNELSFGDRPVLRYMYEALDDSNPKDRERTYKVYHQVYNPAGDAIITKPHGGQFTHHRGLFFGFNRITYGDNKKCDTWHCSGDTHLAHTEFISEDVGPLLGRHTVGVAWNGQGKETFAEEERQMTVYNVPDGTLIEFASLLETTGGPIRLDGDPQHAGFQFRAAQEVAAETSNQTYYLRPDGKGEMGQTRNWPGDKDVTVNLPWNAMSFVVGGQRYTAVYLDHPNNPKEARYSERPYGRFGSYFEYDLTKDNPLKLNYRVWVQEGEMTADQVKALSNDFTHPVHVDVIGK